MPGTRFVRSFFVAATFCLAACSPGSSGVSVSQSEAVATDPPVTDPVVTDPPVTDPVVTDPPVTDPVVTDPPVTQPVVTDPPATQPVVTDPPATDELPSVVEFDASLAAALLSSTSADTLRTTVFQAQRLVGLGLGINQVTEIDPVRPNSVTEVDANGDSYARLDLTSQFVATNPSLVGDESVVLEIWNTPDIVVMDSTAYEFIEEANPGQLGVFSPGLFSIDVARIAALGDVDLAAAFAGAPPVDIGTVASGLLDRLESPVPTGDVANEFIGRISFADLIEVQGGNPVANAQGASAGFALGTGLDARVLADIYLDFYENTVVDALVGIGDDGVLERLEFEADLSGVFEDIGALMLNSDPSVGADERAEVEDAFDEVEFTLSTLIEFEIDSSIVVTLPDGPLEDRTDQAIAFATESGLFD